MDQTSPPSTANPDLSVYADNKPRWNAPEFRRAGFHGLHRNSRYVIGLRSDRVLTLEKDADRRIAERDDVRRITASPIFSAMVVLRDQKVLHEAYAPDFGPDAPHSIQSITKTTLNFMVGGLVAEGLIDLQARVADYLPEIGSGYAAATLQQVLNMDVDNRYSEDYDDPYTSSYLQEIAMGWRLPAGDQKEQTQHSFLLDIEAEDVTNTTGHALYKSANSDVLAWVVERVSGRPLRGHLIDIVEAAGLAGVFHSSTDREGVPVISGGGCMTARDLARYGALFVRRGQGVDGRRVGCASFIEKTRRDPGPPMPAPRDWIRYSNQTNTNGRWLGHGGYGGQYLLADLESGVVGVVFSVLENKSAHDPGYSLEIIRMLEAIAAEAS